VLVKLLFLLLLLLLLLGMNDTPMVVAEMVVGAAS
jgi:hypothetical protein